MQEKQPQSEMKQNNARLPDKKTIRIILAAALGIGLLILLRSLSGTSLSNALPILWPLLGGFMLAYLLNLPMRAMESRLPAKMNRRRSLALGLTYLLFAAFLVLLLLLAVPQLVRSIVTFFESVPEYLLNLSRIAELLVARFGVGQETINQVSETVTRLAFSAAAWLTESLPGWAMETVGNVGAWVASAATALIASVYMLARKEHLTGQCKRVLYAFVSPPGADRTVEVARLSDRIFSAYVTGKVINSVIIGGVCFAFMMIMNGLHAVTGLRWFHMPYAPLISVVIGITNIIPYFGPLIGTIPSVAILLLVSPVSALVFLVFILLLQQFDGNFLTPRILGNSTGLPALWVFIATVAGGRLWGISGMLLSVPVAAVLYILASDVVADKLKKRGLDPDFAREE